MNLVAIPNDALDSYRRIPEEDFLSEFNPQNMKGQKFFDNVIFINWKDKKDGEYAGVKSLSFLKDKNRAMQFVKGIGDKKIKVVYPLFTEIFEKEIGTIVNRAKQVNPDFLRAFNADHAAETGILLRRELKLPLVISVHDRSRVTQAIHSADSLVCISQGLVDKCVNEYRVSPRKIVLIPDGIDMSLFSPLNSSEIFKIVNPSYDSQHKILSVGRFTEDKNLERLLGAVKIVSEELSGVTHLHLGKDLPERESRIKELASSLGLEGTTYFLGSMKKRDLSSYYSWADVFLFPSLREGLGRAQIEALACGTPSVTSNKVPMTEVVKDGFNGLIIDPENTKEMASQVLRILTDKSLKNKLIFNARNSVRGYDVRRIMQAHCDNYKKVLMANK